MLTRCLLLAVLIMLLPPPAFSDDLYLLSIESTGQLEAVREIVDHAHGLIDGRFVVQLDTEQYQKLVSIGIEVELIVEQFEPETFHVVYKARPDVVVTPVTLSPVYTKANRHVVQIGAGEADVLRRAGYMVFRLADKQTPFFYEAPMTALPPLDDYPTDTIADLVNQDSLYNYVARLQAFQTRFVKTDSLDYAG